MLKILPKDEIGNEIAVVVGTRPGIVKFSPVIHELKKRKVPFFIIHTGQHYSFNMDRQFFEDLELPIPKYTNDRVREETLHGAQTGEMLRGIEAALLDGKPKIVIVGGDANTNLAGALATRKLGIPLAHMEAGLRSHDWQMPEEHNRVIIDHISELLLPPTEKAKQNLEIDNVKGEMHIVGNPIVDAVYLNQKIAESKSRIIQTLGLSTRKYYLFTMHREENVDLPETFTKHIENIAHISRNYDREIIFPMHPRTKKRLAEFGWQERFENEKNLRIIDPVGYLDFLLLMKNAELILTDSGGIQEEACIMNVPCLTLRENTERPETIDVGANIIVGCDMDKLIKGISHFSDAEKKWENPFGDGTTATKIVDILEKW